MARVEHSRCTRVIEGTQVSRLHPYKVKMVLVTGEVALLALHRVNAPLPLLHVVTLVDAFRLILRSLVKVPGATLYRQMVQLPFLALLLEQARKMMVTVRPLEPLHLSHGMVPLLM